MSVDIMRGLRGGFVSGGGRAVRGVSCSGEVGWCGLRRTA